MGNRPQAVEQRRPYTRHYFAALRAFLQRGPAASATLDRIESVTVATVKLSLAGAGGFRKPLALERGEFFQPW